MNRPMSRPINPTLRGCFVAGTDTDVGKTCISAALLHLLGRQGWRCAGLKPISAGQDERDGAWSNEDVRLLQAASTMPLSSAQVGPVQFRQPCAPHIAAALSGQNIAPHIGLTAAQALMAAGAEVLVVEGVGGFAVPLAADLSWGMDDLAAELALPVILVVGLRLGCLNHALLTAQAVAARGLKLVGWVANTVDPAMAHRQSNIEALKAGLQRRYGSVFLGEVPRLTEVTPVAVAAYLDGVALRQALDFEKVRP
jgi:dethiobiotin synthetase